MGSEGGDTRGGAAALKEKVCCRTNDTESASLGFSLRGQEVADDIQKQRVWKKAGGVGLSEGGGGQEAAANYQTGLSDTTHQGQLTTISSAR